MARSNLSAAAIMSGTDAVVPATVLKVRKEIYSKLRLTPSEMDLVFEIAQKAGSNPCPEWTSLFCEALTDYVVHQNVPEGYIPQDKADWLIQKLTDNGGISSKTEFAMLIKVMTHALGVPPSLSAFALGQIKAAIINGRRNAIADVDHPAGVATKEDVEALRAVLYAATTGTACHVSREEAEVLFEIADATSRAQNDPSFDDLFARAVGNYLMAISAHAPDAAEALRFEKWLDEKEDLLSFLSRMLHRAPQTNIDIAKREADEEMLRNESEKITNSEANWVIARITRDGKLTSAESRLLQFLGVESRSIPSSLRSLVDKANKAAAV